MQRFGRGVEVEAQPVGLVMQLGFNPRDEVALGEFGETRAERDDDRLQPLGGARALGGDRRLGFLERGLILQRLNHADERAGRIADQVGVDREVDARAARQVAPVLGFQAVAAAAVALRGIERADFRRPAFEREIGEARTRREVEALPMILGADHLGRLEAGQAGAGVVPHRDATVAVEDECRNRHFVDDPRRVSAEIRPVAAGLALAGPADRGDRLPEAGKNHPRSPR